MPKSVKNKISNQQTIDQIIAMPPFLGAAKALCLFGMTYFQKGHDQFRLAIITGTHKIFHPFASYAGVRKSVSL